MWEKGRGLCTAQPAQGGGELRTVTPNLEVTEQGCTWQNGKMWQDETSGSAAGAPGAL